MLDARSVPSASTGGQCVSDSGQTEKAREKRGTRNIMRAEYRFGSEDYALVHDNAHTTGPRVRKQDRR
jgi:hypothetical protein